MKSAYKHYILIFIMLFLITPQNANAIDSDGNKTVSLISVNPAIDPVKFQQTKAQVYLMKQVLDELGATSPFQAANLWAKSELRRNGVYQYVVSCEHLKQKLIDKWGKAEESYWIIGASSPWTNKYEIVKSVKTSENRYRITLKFYWFTSAGVEKPTYNTLTIVKGEKYWCVTESK